MLVPRGTTNGGHVLFKLNHLLAGINKLSVRSKLYGQLPSGDDGELQLTAGGTVGGVTEYDDESSVAAPAKMTVVGGYDNADGKPKSLLVGLNGGLYVGFVRNSNVYGFLSGQIIGSFPYTSPVFSQIDSIGISRYKRVLIEIRLGSDGSSNLFTVDVQGALVDNTYHYRTYAQFEAGGNLAQGDPYYNLELSPIFPFNRLVVTHVSGTLGATQDITVNMLGIAL